MAEDVADFLAGCFGGDPLGRGLVGLNDASEAASMVAFLVAGVVGVVACGISAISTDST